MQLGNWLNELESRIPEYVKSLGNPQLPGRFSPALRGVTEHGSRLSLGFSCLALKVNHTFNRWDQLSTQEQSNWIRYIKSFQEEGNRLRFPEGSNAFLDKSLVQYLSRPRSLGDLKMSLLSAEHRQRLRRVIVGETKQAIAALAEHNEASRVAYDGFPSDSADLLRHLDRLDWTKPWGAGAHAAAIAVFLNTQAPRFLGEEEVRACQASIRSFISSLVDSQTGGYFQGDVPNYAMLVNGAMKVLTGLDWLGDEVHYPEKLIDTCLSRLPDPEGCHLVDTAYVLYRCSRETNYRRLEVSDYCEELIGIIREHYMQDEGGFSYHIGKSQTHYYGVQITAGAATADIHGTVLLSWAISMIQFLSDKVEVKWNVIRP